MNRNEFHKLFKTPGPVVLPVIHVLDSARTRRNVEVLLEAGAQGCFLINHDFEPEKFLPIIRDTRAAFPSLWMAVNFLAVTGKDAFPILGQLEAEGCIVDAYWADDACIDEDGVNAEAKEIAAVREKSGWSGLYFGGTAFKKQREVDPSRYGDAAREACGFMDVITTSGVATGQEADLGKIETPLYVQAGREDHIAPPESVIKLLDHVSGPARFIVAGSGHIAGVINHPAAKKYQHWTNKKKKKYEV